jgi:hypothetical protein
MKTRKNGAFLGLSLFAICLGLLAHDGVGAAQGPQKLSSLVPLTDDEEATMIFIREEEKLARDVYIVMYETWGAPIFSNTSVAEQRHMDAVLRLLNRYEVADPVSNNPVGVFTDGDLQELYNKLVLQGQASVLDAYVVGKAIEEMDIQSLQEAIDETDKADLLKVYDRLQEASYSHLLAFESHIAGLTP